MSLRLILMRHAKSAWDHPGLDDHDRPLNGRGRRSAAAMGDWLRDQGYMPDAILSSSATRTRETAAGLGFDVPASFTPPLYLAGPDAMLSALRSAQGKCVLMLGHNPGIAWFAEELVATPPAHPRFDDYPTCATLVLEFPVDRWSAVQPGTGQVLAFITPREVIQ